jgi:biopolymer transport protein ExbD
MRTWLLVLALVACKGNEKKSGRIEEKTAETPAPKADPDCANKTNQLQAWLEQLREQKSTEEINFGWQPVVLDREPAKVSQSVDNATVTPKSVAAFDSSESNHVGDNIGAKADAKKVSERLTAIFNMKSGKDDDVLRVDVDAAAPWSEVAKLVDAAVQVGYTKVVFAFEATSKLAMPNGVTGPTTDSKVTDEANAKLEEMRKTCPGWGYSPQSNAEAIRNCNCKVDPDEVRVQTWKAEMWHQAHTRVGVELAIAKDGRAIEQPGATPWSEAHKMIVDTQILDQKNPAKLVAK